MEVYYLDEWIIITTACCWFPTSSNILILPSQLWQIRFECCWLHCSKCRIRWCFYGTWRARSYRLPLTSQLDWFYYTTSIIQLSWYSPLKHWGLGNFRVHTFQSSHWAKMSTKPIYNVDPCERNTVLYYKLMLYQCGCPISISQLAVSLCSMQMAVHWITATACCMVPP